MDQPKIERLLRLMKMLTANVEYSVDDLAERLNMSRRTIYRYIDTFRDAGFVIKKSGDCIRLDKESPHFKDISQLVHFTEEEAVILRRAIESIDDTNLLKQNLKRKLYSVYDNHTLADTVVRGRNAGNVHTLIDAIQNKYCVVLQGYKSSHSARDRKVEPFAFTTNYVNVWCLDREDGKCKIFKVARIDNVEATAEPWLYEAQHEQGFMDIFRTIATSQERIHAKVKLGRLSHNLLLEEYPLSERFITPCKESSDSWLLETDVANLHGIGRFVAGLLDDIQIIDSPELEEHLNDYLRRYAISREPEN
ncbi:MAG: WYL domain-containing protein [Alistipes sp.]|nr:WYL domain-containing protein [Alistipes sp.]MBQ7856999.1 WYL domain-containing protein [Alistipes sp.]